MSKADHELVLLCARRILANVEAGRIYEAESVAWAYRTCIEHGERWEDHPTRSTAGQGGVFTCARHRWVARASQPEHGAGEARARHLKAKALGLDPRRLHQ